MRMIRGISAEPRPQLDEVGEHVGLAAQLVGDHRRLARDSGDDGDADTAALNGLDQRAEIAVAGKQDHLVDMPGEFHGVDGQLDIHAALHPAAAARVGEFPGGFGDDGVAVVIEPVDQRPDRRVLLGPR
jgi:hypothetical protein